MFCVPPDPTARSPAGSLAAGPCLRFVNRSGPATRFDNTRPESTLRACRDGLRNSFTAS